MIAPLYPHLHQQKTGAGTPVTGKDFTVDSTRKKQATPTVSYERYESDERYESEESEGKCVKLRKGKESDCCSAFAEQRTTSSTPRVTTIEDAGKAILNAAAQGEPSPLPWEHHVLGCVWIQHHGEHLEYEHWTEGFTFLRYLKTHPAMKDVTGSYLDADEAFTVVDAAIRRMGTTWEEHLDMGRDDVEASFLDAWDKIKAVPGQHPVDAAMADAAGEQVLFKPGKLKISAASYLDFLVLCYHLFKRSRHGEIALPVEGRIPERLGVKPITISRYRRWAVEDGLLEPTEPASWKSGRAARFMLNAERWKEVTQ